MDRTNRAVRAVRVDRRTMPEVVGCCMGGCFINPWHPFYPCYPWLVSVLVCVLVRRLEKRMHEGATDGTDDTDSHE